MGKDVLAHMSTAELVKIIEQRKEIEVPNLIDEINVRLAQLKQMGYGRIEHHYDDEYELSFLGYDSVKDKITFFE